MTPYLGYRWTTADAYLSQSSQSSSNLAVSSNSHVERIIFDRWNRAIGVRVRHGGKGGKGGRTRNVYAMKEVILSAGTVGSPQLLMLSGVGPRKHLDDVKVNHDTMTLHCTSLNMRKNRRNLHF